MQWLEVPVDTSVTAFIYIGVWTEFSIESSYLTVHVVKSPLIASKLEHASYLISEWETWGEKNPHGIALLYINVKNCPMLDNG